MIISRQLRDARSLFINILAKLNLFEEMQGPNLLEFIVPHDWDSFSLKEKDLLMIYLNTVVLLSLPSATIVRLLSKPVFFFFTHLDIPCCCSTCWVKPSLPHIPEPWDHSSPSWKTICSFPLLLPFFRSNSHMMLQKTNETTVRLDRPCVI